MKVLHFILASTLALSLTAKGFELQKLSELHFKDEIKRVH